MPGRAMRKPPPLQPARLPRKAARRVRVELLSAAAVLLMLLGVLRAHHHGAVLWSRPASHSRAREWPRIEPRHPLLQLPAVPRNLYYGSTDDVLYCYIPKVASSRFKPLLRKREGFRDWADPAMVHGMRNGLQRLMWLSRPLAMRRLLDRDVKSFVVVRNPFSRLVSAYQNKIATPWPDQRNDFWDKHLRRECPAMVAGMDMPREGPLMSIETFLKCLLSTDNTEPSNEHWRPQADLCALDYIRYDKYLHLETLPTDVVDLLDFLGWKENGTAFQMHRNPVYSRQLEDYFSDEALELTLKYYKDDFDVLKYPRVPTGRIDFYSVFDGTNFQPGFVPPVDFQPPTVHNETVPQKR